MDPALLREREAFRKKAINMPIVESRKRPTDEPAEPSKNRLSKKTKPERERTTPREFDYKAAAGSTTYKFAVLKKIVDYLKMLHQDGDTEAVSIENILDDTNQTDISARIKHWLVTQSLCSNPKIEVVDGNYKFKPVYNIHDRKGLLSLLKEKERMGEGFVEMEILQDSVPNFAKVMKDLKDSVHHLVTQADKKGIMCYKNKAFYPPQPIDEEVQMCFRSVAVEGTDEQKLEEYLRKNNIVAMGNLEIKRATTQKRKAAKRKVRPFKTHNDHLDVALIDYTEKQ